MELKNNKNGPVIFHIENFVYFDSKKLRELTPDDRLYNLLAPNQVLCFTITEPDPMTFIPKVSEPRLGKILDKDESSKTLRVQLRTDFRVSQEEEEQ